MALITRLIAWMIMITEIFIYGKSSGIHTTNEKCEISMTSVHCEGLSGKFLPSDCSVYVSVMYIMESNMSSLSEDDFAALENLSTIYIDTCTIAFGSNIFSPVKSLHKLEIINSNASEEIFNLLGSARQLVKLSLEGNKLTYIKKGIFNSVSHLEETDVHHRKMSEIMNFTTSESQFPPFRNASNLTTTSFENNKPVRVKKQIFDRLLRLEEIDLSHNEISAIEAGAFQGLTSLRKLDISHNRLTGVFDHSDNKGVFYNLSGLQEIDLSHNEISAIEADAFEGLPALRRLDLSHNMLSDDFDPASISLPAGCDFQSLVATCPEPATDNEPSHEDQRSAPNVTTRGPQPQMKPPRGFTSDSTGIQGGLDFAGLLGATLLLVFTVKR